MMVALTKENFPRRELQQSNVAENLTLILITEMSENIRLPFDTTSKVENVEQRRF